jgi:hypothetical protein
MRSGPWTSLRSARRVRLLLSEVEKYGEKNMSIDQIKSVALEQHVDPLDDCALKCLSELRTVYARARVGWGQT